MNNIVTVTLRNPLDSTDLLTYRIIPRDSPLTADWIAALTALLQSGLPIEKNYCFLGFPDTARTLTFCCSEMNRAILQINASDIDYVISEQFTPETVLARDWAAAGPNHELFNGIHCHFERLQGTVGRMSPYYTRADTATRYAIRQLNLLCHEMETLILSQRKAQLAPDWVRPSQITTWLGAERYALTDLHRQGFRTNSYDRRLGGVYMHWTQIGKTLFEVFRDESAPELDATTCSAITHLEWYSGEFDVEWGRSVCAGDPAVPWHTTEQAAFRSWLNSNGLDPEDPQLSLGYLQIGQVDLLGSFGTDDPVKIWAALTTHLDIVKIQVGDVAAEYPGCWTDADWAQQQQAILQGA